VYNFEGYVTCSGELLKRIDYEQIIFKNTNTNSIARKIIQNAIMTG
jgi:hypothetical protein